MRPEYIHTKPCIVQITSSPSGSSFNQCIPDLLKITGDQDIHFLVAVSIKIFGILSMLTAGSVAIVHLFHIGKFNPQEILKGKPKTKTSSETSMGYVSSRSLCLLMGTITNCLSKSFLCPMGIQITSTLYQNSGWKSQLGSL